MEKARLNVEPTEVGFELRKASPKSLAGERLGLEVEALEDPEAFFRVGFGQGGRDAGFGDVEAAAFDQERLPRLTLEIQPQLPGFEGEPRVNRIEIVVEIGRASCRER